MHANNEYVEPINLHPDEFEDDDLIYLIRFGNITSEFNRSITPTATEDLKVGDIIKSKVKLLQIITEWSIKRGVPFAPVKTAGCRTPREGSMSGALMLTWLRELFLEDPLTDVQAQQHSLTSST